MGNDCTKSNGFKTKIRFRHESKKRKSPPEWSRQLADEMHRPLRRQFKKRRVISNRIDEIWAADLVQMAKFSKWNKGIKYLLMVIDDFFKIRLN